jgi:carbonic anhydrase/acetyltransferase-like protein (isoleucine patch superfamily)
MQFEFEGIRPRVHEETFIAPTAVLIGDVTIGARASIWFGAVLRGDFGAIVVGDGSNVQDNVVIHASERSPTLIGAGVTIGHLATLESCIVEDDAFIGMGAVVLSEAKIGAGALIAAGAVVGEGFEVPPGMLAAGVPARVVRELTENARGWLELAAPAYQRSRIRYLAGLRAL